MYIIIWEYQVKPEHTTEFEEGYSSSGAWAQLFQKSKGFLKTELLRDEKHPGRYLTIDEWISPQEYEHFLSHWGHAYAALDAHCEHLTEQELLLYKGESVSGRTP